LIYDFFLKGGGDPLGDIHHQFRHTCDISCAVLQAFSVPSAAIKELQSPVYSDYSKAFDNDQTSVERRLLSPHSLYSSANGTRVHVGLPLKCFVNNSHTSVPMRQRGGTYS